MKIFGIGLNKTGTTSLHHAIERLGFTSLHWGGMDSRRAVERAIREGVPLLTHLPDRDAYSDIQRLAVNFATLDEQYPGSRFVLTTRPIDAWLDSRRRHVETNRARRTEGAYDGTFLDIEIERWTALYERHHSAVAEYFAERTDLLTMDVTAGDGYDLLAPFLDRPVPDEPFPSVRWPPDRGPLSRLRSTVSRLRPSPRR